MALKSLKPIIVNYSSTFLLFSNPVNKQTNSFPLISLIKSIIKSTHVVKIATRNKICNKQRNYFIRRYFISFFFQLVVIIIMIIILG